MRFKIDMAYADEQREYALMIKAQRVLKDKEIIDTELGEQIAHADEGPESNVQKIHALLQRREAACARLQALVGEESEGSSPCSSPLQRRVRPGSASPDGLWSAPSRGEHPTGSQPSKTRRPLTAEPRRSGDGLATAKPTPRRSDDGLSNANSRSPKGRDADADTRPQAQRKGMFSLLASSLYNALTRTRTKTSRTGSPETKCKVVTPETAQMSDEHMMPPAEPTRLRPQDVQSRSKGSERAPYLTTSMREPTPRRHGTRARDYSQSFTYGEQNHRKEGTKHNSPSELNKTKSPSELREELLALFGAAKESGAVKEVDGCESPPPRSPPPSRVKKAGGARANSIEIFKASHLRHDIKSLVASSVRQIVCGKEVVACGKEVEAGPRRV